jgi:hypothetical protein
MDLALLPLVTFQQSTFLSNSFLLIRREAYKSSQAEFYVVTFLSGGESAQVGQQLRHFPFCNMFRIYPQLFPSRGSLKTGYYANQVR